MILHNSSTTMVGKILMMCFSQSLDRVIGKCSKNIQRGENHYSQKDEYPR